MNLKKIKKGRFRNNIPKPTTPNKMRIPNRYLYFLFYLLCKIASDHDIVLNFTFNINCISVMEYFIDFVVKFITVL